MKLRVYRGALLERHPISGMWHTFLANHGTLRADTLGGLKYLIREALQ